MARHLYRATLSRLTRRGANVEIVETASHGEGIKATAEAALSGRFDAVVAAGGDGTVHDAEGLVGHSIPLGILPLGTGNVFARELKLPTSPDMIARTLLFGYVRTIPIGQANGRPFLFVVVVGFDAEAIRLFESEGNRTLGRAGYIWPVLRALLSHQDQSLRQIRAVDSHSKPLGGSARHGVCRRCDRNKADFSPFRTDPQFWWATGMAVPSSRLYQSAAETIAEKLTRGYWIHD